MRELIRQPLFWAAFIVGLLFSIVAFSDEVRLKNGRTIEAPFVLDKHGLFGEADETNEAVPEGKVRLKFDNGYMDIPEREIEDLVRTQ